MDGSNTRKLLSCEKSFNLHYHTHHAFIYIYFIAEDIHLIAFIQCNIEKKINALRGMMLINTKVDKNQPENDLNLI